MTQRIENGRVSISLTQRIPCELWSTIFVLCLPSHPSVWSQDTPKKEVLKDPRLAPVILASICRTWRDMVFNTKALWRTCWLNFQHPEHNTVWLRRAGTSMLHLYGRHDCTNFNATALMRSILPFQRRWKSFELGFGYRSLAVSAYVDFIVEFDCPVLESFASPIGDDMPSWLTGIVFNSPLLRELTLCDLWLGLSLTLADTHLPFLTKMSVCQTSPEDVIAILRTLPQIQHLECGVDEEHGYNFILSPTTHANLTRLTLLGNGVSKVLSNITLPSLSALHVSGISDPECLLGFFERSSCRVTKLILSCRDLAEEMTLSILEADSVNAHIEKLWLEDGDNITPGVLNFLRFGQDKRQLPHLNQLSLNRCDLTKIPEGLMADVILSRYRRQPSCECSGYARPRAKEVSLGYMDIQYLDKAVHGLDIARLVPLPSSERGKGTVKAVDGDSQWMGKLKDKYLHPVRISGDLSSLVDKE